ncbi:hypothetical protein EYF80_028575 [Liparis tanakae]|uniref:Uncharacterized protein n=1 Tax=Liparis tanakae TaxID=230148 RepID=A0A4Z2H6Q6_9TELE|nr:hypothetical protein EYF80_028575 [Liparis tanakae]
MVDGMGRWERMKKRKAGAIIQEKPGVVQWGITTDQKHGHVMFVFKVHTLVRLRAALSLPPGVRFLSWTSSSSTSWAMARTVDGTSPGRRSPLVCSASSLATIAAVSPERSWESNGDDGLTNEDGYAAAILPRSQRVSMRENSPGADRSVTPSCPETRGLGAEAARAGSGVQTYFLHDVVDPWRRAVAEVGAAGIPVAQMCHAHVRGHAFKTSETNWGCLAIWPCCVRGHDMSAVSLGLQKSWGCRAGACGTAGGSCTGGERPPAFWLVSGIWLVSDDEPPAGAAAGWRTVVVVRKRWPGEVVRTGRGVV